VAGLSAPPSRPEEFSELGAHIARPETRAVIECLPLTRVLQETEPSKERKRDSGTVGETSTPTVAWWLEHRLTTIAPRRVRQRTLESYVMIAFEAVRHSSITRVTTG
jgi:hypothetical protein